MHQNPRDEGWEPKVLNNILIWTKKDEETGLALAKFTEVLACGKDEAEAMNNVALIVNACGVMLAKSSTSPTSDTPQKDQKE